MLVLFVRCTGRYDLSHGSEMLHPLIHFALLTVAIENTTVVEIPGDTPVAFVH